jgi:hypothetical protein
MLVVAALIILVIGLIHAANTYLTFHEQGNHKEYFYSLFITLGSILSVILIVIHILKEWGWLS